MKPAGKTFNGRSIAYHRLTREQETARRQNEIELAHAFMCAEPDLGYAEALRHAYAKLNRTLGAYKP